MNKINVMLIIFLFLLGGCRGNSTSGDGTNTFIAVDINANYSEKKLILQDFMDVEYIPLETSDEFLCQGRVLDIGKEFILVRNEFQDGNIFVFDRNGKGVRKINHRGVGGEEYTIILGVALDEDNGEIFVNDIFSRKIVVYDLFGKFRRSLPYNEGIKNDNIYNLDREHLIYEAGLDSETSDKSTFMIVSKRDGSTIHKIEIPYKQKKSTMISDDSNLFVFYQYYPILPFQGSWILTEASSDTVFSFSPDKSMIPFIARTQSIQSMNPEVFLFPKLLTDHYYFMEKVKKEKEFTKTDLMYDRQDKTIYEYILYNNDYSNKEPVNMVTWDTKNDEIGFWQKIEVYELLESYRKGELKGKLKDITARLDEKSNPVIMLAKNKKSF